MQDQIHLELRGRFPCLRRVEFMWREPEEVLPDEVPKSPKAKRDWLIERSDRCWKRMLQIVALLDSAIAGYGTFTVSDASNGSRVHCYRR